MLTEYNSWSCLCSRKTKSIFPSLFHLLPDSCQSHNRLIRSRLSWRQWADSGLMEDLRFGSRLCGHKKEPFILTLIPSACVRHERPICVFEGGLRPAVSLFLCVVLAV